MKSRLALRCWPLVLVLAAAISAEAALTVGGAAYTKRVETVLLSEPRVLASASAKLGYGRKLKVLEIQGGWVKVSEGNSTGWVFAGNISDAPPVEGKGLDGVTLLASETSATAAARPLTPTAEEYSQRRNLGSASGDLNWLLSECATYTPEKVEAFLKEHKKGEYQ